MKTILKISLIILLTSFVVKVSAQDSPLRFGVKAGFNLGTMFGDVDDRKVKFGLNFGGTVDYSFTEEMILISGLEFSNKGMKSNFDSKITQSFIQLPIHFGYKLKASDNFDVILHAGPYLAVGVDAKLEQGGFSVDAYKKYDGMQLMNRFDFGLGLGANLEIQKHWVVGLAFDFGLLNMISNDVKSITDDYGNSLGEVKARNAVFNLSAGYKF